MTTFRQTFSIRGQPFGEGLRHADTIGGEVQVPWSVAFFCPQCGDIWAKATVEGSAYHVYAHSCDRHPSTTPVWIREVPGSIWLPLDKDYEDSLSKEVLKREMDLRFEHILRNEG